MSNSINVLFPNLQSLINPNKTIKNNQLNNLTKRNKNKTVFQEPPLYQMSY